MKTYSLLLVAFFAATTHLVAGSVASVIVETWITPPLGIGTPTCSLTSTGAAVSCISGSAVPPFAEADGSASASFGFLSLHTNVIGFSAEADARATAQYDYLINFPGASSGTITGKYFISGSTVADFQTFGAWELSISQGGTLSQFPPPFTPTFTELVTLSFPFTAGQTVEITGSLLGFADTPGNETTDASLQLMGFFDQAGNPLSSVVTDVPEPSLWPVLLLSVAILYIHIRRKPLSRHR